jgi:nucleoside-diphosphate-sugar epimerase
MSKNILITGGAGFLGRGVIKHLLNDTEVEKITVFDNFISSNKQDFEKFIKKYDTKNKVIFVEYDITNLENMTFVKNTFQFDEIYHLASLASPPFYKKYPIETLEVGYTGTKYILEIAKEHKAKILFSSTSEVYGDPEITPQQEDYKGNVNSFGVRCSYDESKRVAEALCYTYIKEYNLDVKIARIFNTYGPEMMISDGRIITETIRHLMNNTTLKIYGTGEQTRSCSFVDDTVNMLVKLMASDCNIPVNIGNNEERTINETVNIIKKVYQDYIDLMDIIYPANENKVKITLKKEYIPLTQDDPLKRCPCLIRNKTILGEREYTSFEKGIFKTIEYFLEN